MERSAETQETTRGRDSVFARLFSTINARPRISAWIFLSVAIAVLLLIEARDVGLLFGQWVALIAASTLVAGLCIWIVSWEDKEESDGASTAASNTTPPVAEDRPTGTVNGTEAGAR